MDALAQRAFDNNNVSIQDFVRLNKEKYGSSEFLLERE